MLLHVSVLIKTIIRELAVCASLSYYIGIS